MAYDYEIDSSAGEFSEPTIKLGGGYFSRDDRQLGAVIGRTHAQIWRFAPGRGLVSSSTFRFVAAGGPFYFAGNAEGLFLMDWASG